MITRFDWRPSQRHKLIGIGMLAAGVLVLPIPIQLSKPVVVHVVDESHLPVTGIEVTRSWFRYSFGLSGFDSQVSTSGGVASFAAIASWRPAPAWIVMMAGQAISVHSGFGRAKCYFRVTEQGYNGNTEVTVSNCLGSEGNITLEALRRENPSRNR